MKVFRRLGVRWMAWLAIVAVLEFHPHVARAAEVRSNFCGYSENDFTSMACNDGQAQCDVCCAEYGGGQYTGGFCLGDYPQNTCLCY